MFSGKVAHALPFGMVCATLIKLGLFKEDGKTGRVWQQHSEKGLRVKWSRYDQYVLSTFRKS